VRTPSPRPDCGRPGGVGVVLCDGRLAAHTPCPRREEVEGETWPLLPVVHISITVACDIHLCRPCVVLTPRQIDRACRGWVGAVDRHDAPPRKATVRHPKVSNSAAPRPWLRWCRRAPATAQTMPDRIDSTVPCIGSRLHSASGPLQAGLRHLTARHYAPNAPRIAALAVGRTTLGPGNRDDA
jgi:hypothetical protein